jgi:hypothetical protein
LFKEQVGLDQLAVSIACQSVFYGRLLQKLVHAPTKLAFFYKNDTKNHGLMAFSIKIASLYYFFWSN